MKPLQPGDPAQVGGFALLGRLGPGGMGRVFLGVTPGGRKVAVKLIRPEYADCEEFRRRFAREVQAARKVGGFHTAQVVDADPDAVLPWMALAYIPGPSLADAIAGQGPFDNTGVLALGAALAEGLSAIHACGLIHRDVKPGNVILAEDGPRIVDFGLAYDETRSMITIPGTVMGTPGYMSPEQHAGLRVTPATDVFSLGAVLAFAATGTSPFRGETLGEIREQVLQGQPGLAGLPGPLGHVIGRCLVKSPGDRPGLPDLLGFFTSTPRVATGEGHGRGYASFPEAVGYVPTEAVSRPGGTAAVRPRVTFDPDDQLLGRVGYLDSLAFSPDSSLLAAATGGKGVRLWDTSSGHMTRLDGRLHADGRVAGLQWDRKEGGIPVPRLFPDGDRFESLTFSADSRHLLAVGKGGIIRWRIEGDRHPEPVTTGYLSALDTTISPGGRFAVSGGRTPKLLLRDLATGSAAPRTVWEQDGPELSYWRYEFSADGTRLAVAVGTNIHVLDTFTLREVVPPLVLPDGQIKGFCCSPDGRLIATASESAPGRGRHICIRDITGDVLLEDVHMFKRPDVSALMSFSPDSRVLAAYDLAHGVVLWDAFDRRLLGRADLDRDLLSFSPDGRAFGTLLQGRVHLWDRSAICSGREPLIDPADAIKLAKGRGPVRVFFSPDWRMMATYSFGRLGFPPAIRLWRSRPLNDV